MTETDRIIERMMQVTGVETKRELGEIVGGNVYQATQHKRIPDRWFEHLEDKYGADVEFLKTGVHSTAKAEAGEATAPRNEEPKGFDETPKADEPKADEEPAQVEETGIRMDAIPTEMLIDELMDRIPLARIVIGRRAA